MNIDKFLEIERKYNLYDKEIEGIKYWIYERYVIWNYKICAEKLHLMPARMIEKKGYIGYLQVAFDVFINFVTKHHIQKKSYDVCFLSHERRIKVDAYYECMYTEKITEKFKNSIVVEEPFGYKHFKPVKRKNIVYTDYIMACGEIFYIVHSKLKTQKYKKIYNQVKEQMSLPLKEILAEYNVDIDLEELFQILVRRILLVKSEKRLYKKLIKKIQPKVIVEVVHYCAQCMLVNEIANEAGIATIELQHGAMYEDHAAYQYRTNKRIIQLPQIILTFSEYWNDIINLPSSSTRTFAAGFPFFEEKIKEVKAKNIKSGNRKKILFISQGTIGIFLAKMAVDLEKILKNDEYEIVYKLHPAEYTDWKKRYPILQNSNIVVIDNNERGLYELFEESDIQVGVYSTAIYEGLGFGLQTYIYNIAHAETMKKLVKEGYAFFVNSASELYNMITDSKNVRVEVETFWKTNALKNISDKIEDEICKSEGKQKNIIGK